VLLEEIRQFLLELFEKWGLPKALKTDNGDPFGVPTRDVIPIISLWLIGWGITPILNRPKHPQDNAQVERAQGTSSRWAEIAKAKNIEDLQHRLDTIIKEQRDKYPVKRLGYACRTKVFPDLYDKKRPFCARSFDIEAVYEFLSSKTLQRKVSSTGIIALYGKHFQVHLKFKGQYVFLKFNKTIMGWDVINTNKEFLKTISDERFSKNNIILLTVCQ
jgi:transposase InsO family protein